MLWQTELTAQDVDAIFFVSVTVRPHQLRQTCNRLGFRPDIKRIPYLA